MLQADETQAISRLLRIGQRKQVQVTTLFARCTAEERILQPRGRCHAPEQAFSLAVPSRSAAWTASMTSSFGIEDNLLASKTTNDPHARGGVGLGAGAAYRILRASVCTAVRVTPGDSARARKPVRCTFATRESTI